MVLHFSLLTLLLPPAPKQGFGYASVRERVAHQQRAMADACQPQQRNLYQTKFAHLEYRDGLGNSYNEQLRLQSWPIVDDVPPQAQPSASAQVSRRSRSSSRSTDRSC